MGREKTKRTCEKGHIFYKSSDCDTCPTCEREKSKDFFVKLSTPAKNALLSKGIDSVEELAKYSEKDILSLHGIGRTAIPKLQQALSARGLSFKTG